MFAQAPVLEHLAPVKVLHFGTFGAMQLTSRPRPDDKPGGL